MSWFSKKKSIPEKPKPWWFDDWERIKRLYPVGREFDYLGRHMMTTRYDWQGPKPMVVTEYADDRGKLHEWYFYAESFSILLKVGTNE